MIFSFDILQGEGAAVLPGLLRQRRCKAERDGERRVKFVFDGTSNQELPLILGQMPVLPKHYWEGREFDRTTLEPPLGSGPYRIKSVDAGRSIVYERVADYWGADIPVNKGRNNFDTLRYEYYRDPNVALEAFKVGQIDLRVESSSRFWATGYEGPALAKGLITKLEIPTEGGNGMQAFVFNTRRAEVRGSDGCGRRSATRSISSGPTRTCSTASTPAPTATSPTPSWRRTACPGRTSWRCSSRSATGCRKEVFDAGIQAAGDRRLGQQSGQSPRRPWPCSRRPATRSAAASWSTPRPASRWRSRS